jgi:hypothetical protein
VKQAVEESQASSMIDLDIINANLVKAIPRDLLVGEQEGEDEGEFQAHVQSGAHQIHMNPSGFLRDGRPECSKKSTENNLNRHLYGGGPPL